MLKISARKCAPLLHTLTLLGWLLYNYVAFSAIRGSFEDAGFDADDMLERLQAVQQKVILSPKGVMESTGTKAPATKMASSIFTPSPELASSGGKVHSTPSSPRGYE